MTIAIVCIGLALLAVVSRNTLERSLLRVTCYAAGILLYVLFQYAYVHRTLFFDAALYNGNPLHEGFLFGAIMAPALLITVALIPFSTRHRTEIHRLTRSSLPAPRQYVMVWFYGSLFYHFLIVNPLWRVDRTVWGEADLLIGLYSCLLLLAFIIDALAHIGGTFRPSVADSTQASPRDTAGRESARNPGEEERQVQERLARLKEEAEAAERRWAAALLQERAARIQAERFAREFADARRTTNTQIHRAPEQPRTVEDALRILRLVPGCTAKEAKSAYRKMMLEYHPDKVSIMGSQIREIAERKSKSINAAYRILSQALG